MPATLLCQCTSPPLSLAPETCRWFLRVSFCVVAVAASVSRADVAAAAGSEEHDDADMIITPVGEISVDYGEGRVIPLAALSASSSTRPHLFHYNTSRLLHKDRLRMDDPFHNVTEVAPHIYAFNFLSREFCGDLIAEAEQHGDWNKYSDDEELDLNTRVLPEVVAQLRSTDVYSQLDKLMYRVILEHVVPIIQHVWRSFQVQQLDTNSVLRYTYPTRTAMAMHTDAETVAMIVTLNTEYTGGNTLFKRQQFNTKSVCDVGTALLYPGGLSHEHAGVAITSGKRYLMLGAFF